MMQKCVLVLAAAGAALAAQPAAAQVHSATGAARYSHYRAILASTLRARIASINLRIEMLRERQALGREEARELRAQSRSLEIRLHGISAREAADAERDVARVENRVRLAADDARWGGHAYNGELDRHDDFARDEQNRYERERHGDYEHFDRYVGSPVDRWHDPFDRGN